MRKSFSLLFLFGVALYPFKELQAQLPNPYASGTKVSYVRTWEATAPEVNASALMTRPLKDVKLATQYIDGLGRPVQTVMKQGSLETGGTATDMVSASLYDEYGRETKKYLPFAANNTEGNSSVSDGLFKLNPFQQQEVFSQLQHLGETVYYGKTNIEASPLNRALKNMAPGNSWAGSNRGVEMKYWSNTNVDNVQMWRCDNVMGGFGNYVSTGAYPAGQLYKTATVDEHGKQVIEFKDKWGLVILKKVQLTAAPDNGGGTGYANWLCTYYLYDDIARLRCVIQPEGVKQLAISNWQPTTPQWTTILNEQCFRYEYDERSRMIMKKVPGAGEVYMVYDARDRLVMTQDANMRAQDKWMVTKYDMMNRPVETGLWASVSSLSFHQANALNSSSYPATNSGYETLTITHYDDYSGLPAGLSAYLTNWNTHFANTDNNNWPYPQLPQQSNATKGMITWTQTRMLGTSTFLNTVIYYDEKGRAIQTQSTNISGGTDVTTTQYSWAGQPLVTVMKQQKAGDNAQEHTVITKMAYDDLGRMLNIKKTVNSTIGGTTVNKPEQLVLTNKYDKLGQLKEKQLGAGPGSPLWGAGGLLKYDYNIRGWMLGMNRDYLAATGQSGATRFGFELGYDKLTGSSGRNFTAAQYNGNIAGMVWKSDGDDVKRKYDFSYDAANRLMKGQFEQDDATNAWNATTMNYTMQMGDGADPLSAYDANGNIKRMTQYGWKLGGDVNVPIDNLTYNYIEGSNKLLNVIDAANDPLTKLGDFRTSSLHPGGTKTAATVDYTYDANGNLKKDLNKDIGTASAEGIVYNHLNLPSVIIVSPPSGGAGGGGTITYTYDAAGTKIKKEIAEAGQPTKTTMYLAGTVYENDVLQFIGHEEGRIRYKAAEGTNPADLDYDYMIKDHLGNVRMVLTEEQKTDSYPPASMETAQSGTEEVLYANLPATRTPINTIAGYPTDNYTSPNAWVAKVKAAAGSQKIGPSITLRVMAGDKFNLRATSWYKTYGVNPGTPVSPLNDLVAALAGGIGNISGSHGGSTITEIANSGVLTPAATSFLNNQSYNSAKPKAFVNWILFDEQFKFVSSSSGAEQVGANEEFKTHLFTDLPINKNGYLYVYVSNETPNIDVFFDNLQVVHTRGPILEETHYYPFGLTMAGISSRAAGGLENKRKWNKGSELESKEFSDGSGLELYSTFYRSLDPQLGRFWQIDPKPNYEQSLYSSMGNNPISFNDPLGDTLRGSSNQDGRRLQRMIRQTFRGKDMKAVRQLFQRRLFAGDKKTFGTIREGQVNQATAGLSPDQKSLVKGYVDAINSTQVHTVEVARRGESLKDPNSNFYGDRKGGDVDVSAGGGFNIGTIGGVAVPEGTPGTNGTHSVIVMNSTANIPDYRDNNTGNLVPGMTSSRGELLAHELLGHGLTRYNAGGSQFLNAIQLTNMYHRVTGTGNLYRDGTSHGGTTGIPLTYPQASAVPLYLQ